MWSGVDGDGILCRCRVCGWLEGGNLDVVAGLRKVASKSWLISSSRTAFFSTDISFLSTVLSGARDGGEGILWVRFGVGMRSRRRMGDVDFVRYFFSSLIVSLFWGFKCLCSMRNTRPLGSLIVYEVVMFDLMARRNYSVSLMYNPSI